MSQTTTLSERKPGYNEQFDVEGLKFFRRLLDAIQKKEFLVYFQPKISIKEMKIAGAEALVRWNCDGQILSPVKFIPFCERTGLIIDIDFYVLEETCQRMREWMDAGMDLVRISVNFSKCHFYESGVAERIYEVIAGHGIPAGYIEVEFTETAYLDKEELLESTVEKLKSFGIKSSIDDFGSGYSSLNLLQNMDFEAVKLDKSLLGKGVGNTKVKKVISGIIHMAKELDMEVLAEGVETSDELKLLSELQCDMVQGFLFDKPLPAEEFERRLRKRYYTPDYQRSGDERSPMELQDNTSKLEELKAKEREELAKEYFSTNRYLPPEQPRGKNHTGVLVAGVVLILLAVTVLAVAVCLMGGRISRGKSSEPSYTKTEVDEMIAQETDKVKENTKAEVSSDYSKKIREAAEVSGGMANYLRSLYPDDLVFVDGYRFNFVPINRDLRQSTVEAARFREDEDTGFMYYTNPSGEITSYVGVDVSSFQGDIDWVKVASAGVDFAIIRCGIRGYGSEGNLAEDKLFRQNISGAVDAGLQVGVYFFTEALNEAEAVEEADYVLDLISSYSVKGPVILDVEQASAEERIKDITSEQRTDNIIAFCDRISEAGYTPMIYSDMKYFSVRMDISRLEKYKKWYANYNGLTMNPDTSVWAYNNPFMFPYEFDMWQYSANGSVDGITAPVDLNVLFEKWW